MGEPHKHLRLIKLWIEGADIEYSPDGKYWHFIPNPCWIRSYFYRIKRPDWQQKLIDAVKDGKTVEYYLAYADKWVVSELNQMGDNYSFVGGMETHYRIKNKLTDEQLAFRDAADNIGIGDLVEKYFELGDGFWDSRPDEDLIRVHDTYSVCREAIAYTKQPKDKP